MAWGKKKYHAQEQSDEEKSLVSKVQQMYRTAYNNKAEKHKQWSDNFKAYDSELFFKKLPDYKTQEVSNYVFSTVETVLPVMLANDPKILAIPKTRKCYEKSVNVQYALEHEWRRTSMFLQLLEALKYGVIAGTVPIGLFWDQHADRGIGQVVPKVISPFNFFTDPMATCIEDAEYCGYASYKNVGEVIKSYPKQAELLRKAVTAVQDDYLVFGKENTSESRNNVLYIELYMQDYSTEITRETDTDGNEYEVSKLKYPNGRKIVIAGDVLLDDIENPYDDGFPFVLWKCYPIPGQLWAKSEVEVLISPQEAMCSLMNSLIENAELTGNPIWVLDKNSGVEKNTLTNRKGLVVRKNPGTEVRRDAPPSMPAYIQNIISDLKGDIERVSGVYDVTRGEKPAGVTAAAAIEALNESAQGRIKLKVQTMEEMIGQLGAKWLRRIQQFWNTKRSVRIMGIQYLANQQADIDIVMIGGKPIGFKDIDRTDVDGDFDIDVVGGSTMPVNKTAKLQLMIQLAQTTAEDGLPMVDRQTVLESADLGNVEEIIERIHGIQQQQAQQQEAQQQQLMQQQQQQQMAEQMNTEMTRQKQVDEDRQNAVMQHNMELQKMNMQQSLQNTANGVQSVLGGQNIPQGVPQGATQGVPPQLMALLSLPSDKLMELAKSSPQVITLLNMLAEQSNKGTQQGGNK